MRKMLFVLVLLAMLVVATGCATQADVASRNLSQSADSFEIVRRIVFYNGITGDYILEVTGLCSLGNFDPSGSLSVTCKIGTDKYVKHWLGLSDNVTYFAEQLQATPTDPYHYRVIFKPEAILPDIDVQMKP